MKTTDLISSHIDLLTATAPRANASNIEVLMLARERIERLEAAIDVALYQHKRDGAISASVAYDLEMLLCS